MLCRCLTCPAGSTDNRVGSHWQRCSRKVDTAPQQLGACIAGQGCAGRLVSQGGIVSLQRSFARPASVRTSRMRTCNDHVQGLYCSRWAREAGRPSSGHDVGHLLGRDGLGRGQREAALQELLLLPAGPQQGKAAADAARLGGCSSIENVSVELAAGRRQRRRRSRLQMLPGLLRHPAGPRSLFIYPGGSATAHGSTTP